MIITLQTLARVAKTGLKMLTDLLVVGLMSTIGFWLAKIIKTAEGNILDRTILGFRT